MTFIDESDITTAPFTHFARGEWKNLAERTPLPLTAADITRIASLGDPIDMGEVEDIYRPLSALLQLYVEGRRLRARMRSEFLQEEESSMTPFVIGIAGSVAVGKSTVARLLQLLLSRWEHTPRVDLVPTDGFLHPNHILEQRGLLARKGFPESYDRHSLVDFLARLKSGEPHLSVPVYSHVTYDVIDGQRLPINQPDILIVEGLNVLQPPRARPDTKGVAVSDYFDFSIYVDAKEADIKRWYIDRFAQLRSTAFLKEDSYFRTYANLSDAEAEKTARIVWESINHPNLYDNILPTRSRATLIFTKESDHRVSDLHLRKE